MNTRQLTLFSVFLSTYYGIQLATAWLPSLLVDQICGAVIAMFLPYMGTRFYAVFLGYKLVMIASNIPIGAAALQSIGNLGTSLSGGAAASIMSTHPVECTIVGFTAIFIEAYLWLPFRLTKALTDAGFYRRIGVAIGDK